MMGLLPKSTAELIWLHYYNRVLLENKLISEEIYVKMKHIIDNSRSQ